MRPLRPLPPSVRCNRGFGAYFWLTMAIFGAVTLSAAGARWDAGPTEAMSALGVGVTAMAIVIVVRAFVLPALEIDIADGVLRTRRRTTPFSAIAAVSIADHGRAGTWADLSGTDGRRAARMSIAGTLFASPDSAQWAALRHAIGEAALSARALPGAPSVPSDDQMPARAALEILDAQVAWCVAGHSSASRQAPASALRGRRIILAS